MDGGEEGGEEEEEDGEDYILIGVNVYECYKEIESETYY